MYHLRSCAYLLLLMLCNVIQVFTVVKKCCLPFFISFLLTHLQALLILHWLSYPLIHYFHPLHHSKRSYRCLRELWMSTNAAQTCRLVRFIPSDLLNRLFSDFHVWTQGISSLVYFSLRPQIHSYTMTNSSDTLKILIRKYLSTFLLKGIKFLVKICIIVVQMTHTQIYLSYIFAVNYTT